MSDFIRLASQNGPVVVARDAVLFVRPLATGARITLRDSLTTLDVDDDSTAVADQLAPVAKAETKKPEPEPKNEPKPAIK